MSDPAEKTIDANDPQTTPDAHNVEKGPMPNYAQDPRASVPKRKPVPVAPAPSAVAAVEQPAQAQNFQPSNRPTYKAPLFGIPAWFAAQKRSRKYLIVGIIAGVIAIALIIGLAVGLTVGKKYECLFTYPLLLASGACTNES